MNQMPASPKRNRFYPTLLLLLAGGMIGLSAWSAMSSSTMMSDLGLGGTPIATVQYSFAYVEIAKPAYTPLPEVFPVSFPIETRRLITVDAAPESTLPQYNESEDVAPSGEVPAPVYAGNKNILVDISDQYMYVYEGDTLVYNFIASTGMNNSTRIGSFSVLDKIPNAYGSTWNIWMPSWLGIYWSHGLENGIHALPILPNGAQLWEGFLGRPISYGCVVLGAYEASLLYDWVELGTPVVIQW